MVARVGVDHGVVAGGAPAAVGRVGERAEDARERLLAAGGVALGAAAPDRGVVAAGGERQHRALERRARRQHEVAGEQERHPTRPRHHVLDVDRGVARDRQRPARGRDIEHSVGVSLKEAYEGTSRLVTKESRRIRATIPAGVTEGSRIQIKGEGEACAAGAGDLYLVIELEDDPVFERDGLDLTTEVRVDMFTALLGGHVNVPTVTSTAQVKVTAGTQSGRKLKLKGKGMPDGSGGFGSRCRQAHP